MLNDLLESSKGIGLCPMGRLRTFVSLKSVHIYGIYVNLLFYPGFAVALVRNMLSTHYHAFS